MKDYLNQIPLPLLEDIVKGDVIPVLGSGFSMNAILPAGKRMPNWKDLGLAASKLLADSSFDGGPIEALSCYEEQFGRNKLLSLLKQELHIGEAAPSKTNLAICSVFTHTICTTNFDTLIEDSYRSSFTPFGVAASEEELPLLPRDRPCIIKIHGDFEHPNQMVVTESDYDLFLSKNLVMATYLSSLMITHTLLLIGYSFDDPDFRGLWASLTNRLGKLLSPAYCFLVGATSQEVQKYKRREIKVINFGGSKSDYPTVLFNIFTELARYRTEHMGTQAESLDDKVKAQLKLSGKESNLCYLAADPANYGLIKNVLSEALEARGLSLVSSNDVLLPDASPLDAIKVGVQKCTIFIGDVTSNDDYCLFAIAYAKKLGRPSIYIGEKDSEKALFVNNFAPYLFFPDDEKINASFYQIVDDQIKALLPSFAFGNNPFSDAARLLKEKEYSSAIISAYSELEYLCSKRIPGNCQYPDKSFALYTAMRNAGVGSFFRDFRQIRNATVHGGREVSEKEAKLYLDIAKKCYAAFLSSEKDGQ